VTQAFRQQRSVPSIDATIDATIDAMTDASIEQSPTDPTANKFGLSLLGQRVNEPVEHVECFPAPAGLTIAKATTDELMSFCPVTRQPDISTLVIEYEPDAHIIESKSLKLYLWKFKDREIFAEALAVEIADEVMQTCKPKRVRVHLTQRPRGGITIEAIAERHR
jgi:7-cyano-7-deazaguanine reductase